MRWSRIASHKFFFRIQWIRLAWIETWRTNVTKLQASHKDDRLTISGQISRALLWLFRVFSGLHQHQSLQLLAPSVPPLPNTHLFVYNFDFQESCMGDAREVFGGQVGEERVSCSWKSEEHSHSMLTKQSLLPCSYTGIERVVNEANEAQRALSTTDLTRWSPGLNHACPLFLKTSLVPLMSKTLWNSSFLEGLT